MKRSLLVALICVLAQPLAASEIPRAFSHLELLFRSGQFDGYNISAGTRISNSLVRVGPTGDVAITLKGIEYTGDFGIWRYDSKSKTGAVVYRAPLERLLSNPEFTAKGELLFGQYDLGINDGVLKLSLNGNVQTVVDPKQVTRSDFFSNPAQLAERSYLLKTKSVEEGQAIVQVKNGVESVIFAEGEGASYIFSPSCTSQGVCALKLRMGERGQWEEVRPDHIVVFNERMQKTVLTDASSYADSFNNNVGVNNLGDVVVMASYKGKARVLRTSKGRVQIIAQVGESDDIKELETFAPVINDHGHVAFRAIDLRGKRSLYYFNKKRLIKVLSEGDLVPTDRETGRIEEREGWPGFSSGLVLTNHDELYFHAQLWNKSLDKHLGAAIYRLPLDELE